MKAKSLTPHLESSACKSSPKNKIGASGVKEVNMYCRNCGKEIDDKAVVCIACGVPPAKAKKYCQHCGAPTDANAEVCVKCGVRIPSSVEGKDWVVTLILSIFVGQFGVDRFYTGYIGLGILKLLTFGGCGIWWLIDVILIATGKYRDSDGNELVKK